MLKHILNFFLSLRTAIWLLLAQIIMLLVGTFIMPMKEEFQNLHTEPLFDWLIESPVDITWWLWGAIVFLSLLTANTLLCSVESVIRKRAARQWLLIISPQVIHIGFLFMLLAHLLSSYGSFRGTAYMNEGSAITLPNGNELMLNQIKTEVDPSGYIRNWSADIKYYRDGIFIADDVIQPNSPSLLDGLGVYIKTVQMRPFPVVFVEVTREPGALWALVGGILFLAGMISLLVLKIKREDVPGER
ncbi:MAG: hypothetical protein A2X59_04150 [Nitrospirae bacterium GWC2_42_7]|nr:MAG: hypothetical protein A2X59_04150 [Nitrospirae bacterium GWC2_42_7]